MGGNVFITDTPSGQETSLDDLERVRTALPDAPLLIGSGATERTTRGLMELADGVIVGTAVMLDGRAGAGVDPARAAAFVDAAPEGVTVENRQDRTALLAVQGPNARDLIEKVVGAVPKRFGLLEAGWKGAPLWMAGTGYTGEKGGEMAVLSEVAAELWNAFVDAGAVPCGLGSRDTLRLEAGMALYGNDID